MIILLRIIAQSIRVLTAEFYEKGIFK